MVLRAYTINRDRSSLTRWLLRLICGDSRARAVPSYYESTFFIAVGRMIRLRANARAMDAPKELIKPFDSDLDQSLP